MLGQLHDIGKARVSFQEYLKRENGLESDAPCEDKTHSGAGAVWAAECLFGGRLKMLGRILAYPIAGHHAGLPDWIDGEKPNGSLYVRLAEERNVLADKSVRDWIDRNQQIWRGQTLTPPWRFENSDLSFWIRMLFSCLVDADFLDTERFMDADQAKVREASQTLSELLSRFSAEMDDLDRTSADTVVNRIRRKIRQMSVTAAESSGGLFTLTVPTGGGKTLSATAFALRHAIKYGLKRIIYVIPYTSIIEQTADVLRTFLGKDSVVEHHSNLDPDRETLYSRLASENWDAPVIVTTSVQFFESLYSARPSRCRKIHNIAQSVVILDEIQLLPPQLLWPCTEAMAQLVKHYGTTIVLSTATQPALKSVGPLEGISVHKIIDNEEELFASLRRVAIQMPVDIQKTCTWPDIAAELRKLKQVLCIVNSKADCRTLSELLGGESTIYLTTNLCGAHRSQKIAEIKRRLSAGEEVRVVSTQLIEAGVDVDFPVVYRAYTGYSSIIQAAGRCNREGKSSQLGKVVVFMPPKPSPVGILRKQEYAMTELLNEDGVTFDDPEESLRYFDAFYERVNDKASEIFCQWLVKGVRDIHFQFGEAASAMKMIEDATVPVIVRHGEGDELIAKYRAIGHPVREVMRRLQRYTVAVYRNRATSLLERGLIEELPPVGSGIFAQTMPSLYSELYGLDLNSEGPDVTDCII